MRHGIDAPIRLRDLQVAYLRKGLSSRLREPLVNVLGWVRIDPAFDAGAQQVEPKHAKHNPIRDGMEHFDIAAIERQEPAVRPEDCQPLRQRFHGTLR